MHTCKKKRRNGRNDEQEQQSILGDEVMIIYIVSENKRKGIDLAKAFRLLYNN